MSRRMPLRFLPSAKDAEISEKLQSGVVICRRDPPELCHQPSTLAEMQLQPGLILSVPSNQFLQSKMQFVQSKMRNCAVQKHKVEHMIVQFSKSI